MIINMILVGTYFVGQKGTGDVSTTLNNYKVSVIIINLVDIHY